MKIAIVGGGITGLFCGYYLARDNHEVTIIEKSKTGSATSIYNAGLLTPSLAPTPPILGRRILSAYLGKEDPVYISPKQILRNLRWFRTALHKQNVAYEQKIVRLGRRSLELYEEFFTEVGFRPDVINRVAAVYSDESDARKAQASYGGQLLDQESIKEMGFQGFRGGLLIEDELSVNPAKLYKSLWDTLITRGVADLLVGDAIKPAPGTGRHAVLQVDGRQIDCDILIVTAGSWTRELCRQLGYDAPILPARGLAVVFDTGGETLVTTPALLEDYGIGLAQHNQTTIRITGFFEMVGFRTDFSAARKKWLLDKFQRHVVKANHARIVEEGVGFRPCTPDQLPIIGLIPGYENAYVASGNCRLGVTNAPATAELLVSTITGTPRSPETSPTISPAWYDPGRFVS
jgi:D-amino-acid dehydrogenase